MFADLRSVPSLVNVSTLLSIALLSHSTIGAAETLQWKFAVGDSYRLELEQTVQQTTSVLLKPVDTTTTTELVVLWKVKSIKPDGNAVIEQVFDHLKLSVKTQNADDLTFDSKSEEQDSLAARELAKAIAPMLGAPIQVTMAPHGEIIDVQVSEESLEKIRLAAGSMRLRSTLSVEGLQEMLTLVTLPLPKGEVEVDESWSQERASTFPGLQVVAKHELTYRGPQDLEGEMFDRVDIVTSLEQRPLENEGDDKARKAPNIEDHLATGELWFDRENGFAKRCLQTQTLTTTTELREYTIEVNSTSSLECRMTKTSTAE